MNEKIYVPSKKKKREAESFFSSKSFRFLFCRKFVSAMKKMAYIVPIIVIAFDFADLMLSGEKIERNMLISIPLDIIIIWGIFTFIAWVISVVGKSVFRQYTFDLDDESLKIVSKSQLEYRYSKGRKKYLEKIEIISTDYNSDWNAIAVKGEFETYLVCRDNLRQLDKYNGARVFFDYYVPSFIEQLI